MALLYNSATCVAAWLAPGNPLSDFWRRNMDPDLNPFRGIYQLNSFDLAINGQGYFQVTNPNGDTVYTRDGALSTRAR